MDPASLDIVYFVKDGIRNDELRYSLRSVDKNMPYNRVWIFGGCSQFVTPDVRVRVEQEGKTKWDKVRNMYRMVCENKEVTDDFILFNDDFFIMQPTNKIDYLYRCGLDEHIKLIEDGFGHRPTEYTRLLRDCSATLGDRKKLSYELHVPFVFNKKKLLKLLDEYPNAHCMRTMYGNLYEVGGLQMKDIKAFSDKPSFDYKNTQFLSTDDGMVNVNNTVWRYIKTQFSKKSKFEDV